jgi:hypothetical protein
MDNKIFIAQLKKMFPETKPQATVANPHQKKKPTQAQ